MRDDMQCPYCGCDQEVCRDDGNGCEEDILYEHECSECEKSFVFTTMISFSYEAQKADCLNGAPHRWKKTMTYPVEYAVMRCQDCGAERKIEQGE